MIYLSYFENFENFENSNHITEILNHYLQCALWSEETNQDLEDKTISNFSIKSKKDAIEQIRWFVNMSGDALDHILDENIGHDLWLTRNHHGSGFFDRGYDDDIEEIIYDLCSILGEVQLEVGDDDKIYLYSSNKYKDFDIQKYKEDKELKKITKKYNL